MKKGPKYTIGKLVRFLTIEKDSLIGEIESITYNKNGFNYKVGDYNISENQVMATYTEDVKRKSRTRKIAATDENIEVIS